MARTPQIGSISSGTLRSEDLIQAFADELEDLIRGNGRTGMDNANDLKIVDEARDWLDNYEARDGDKSYDMADDVGSHLVNDLIDALNKYAPPYVTFGTQEGDGACFGWWPMVDSLEEDCRDDPTTIIKCDAGAAPSFIMSVNDHGNVTLYRVTLTEVWSVV